MIVLKCIENAYILERGDVVESDHAAVGVDVEWKMKKKGKNKRKRKDKRKGRLTVNKWEVYGRQLEGRYCETPNEFGKHKINTMIT